ncbi:STAS domain-containing protein [Polyangium sorediatum]|uniref:PAS domain-containing protein n=1 Tax=Polyangium sorediatum TaxID=889274 RepID=A0ABT6NSP7_9BACT|nr:STAS domain-containing protein [Polyangium sorediatum]MDI1431355.1 PAS domain-containing protein [Polyangium sorediatum]
MSNHDLEQECKALRARVAELEARLAKVAPDEAPPSEGPNHKLAMAQVLRVLLDHLDIVVWAVDAQGTFTFHDGKALDQVGHQRGQFLGQNVFEVLAGSSPGLRKALAGAPAHEITEAHGIVWENWHMPTHDGQGRVTGVVTLSLDVTEAMRTKAELTTKLALIERQQDVIRNLETPIIQVWDRVLTVPMVGVVDSRRAARVTEDLLAAVSRTQARFAILDLTGVDVVDTATAGHILKILGAVRLLGAEGLITGIRPVVAQTILSLGLDLSRVRTLATLRDGLAVAIRSLGERA